MPKQVIHVREKDGDESVKELDVTGKGKRAVQKIVNGMNINLDHDRFYVDDATAYGDDFDA